MAREAWSKSDVRKIRGKNPPTHIGGAPRRVCALAAGVFSGFSVLEGRLRSVVGMAEKSVDSTLTISAEIRVAVMVLPPEERRDPREGQ